MNVLHFTFGINMEIKYFYSIPLTEQTIEIEYEDFLECILEGEEGEFEAVKDAIKTIAFDDLDGMGLTCDQLEVTVSDETVNAVISELTDIHDSQEQAAEDIREILKDFDYSARQRILSMI